MKLDERMMEMEDRQWREEKEREERQRREERDFQFRMMVMQQRSMGYHHLRFLLVLTMIYRVLVTAIALANSSRSLICEGTAHHH